MKQVRDLPNQIRQWARPVMYFLMLGFLAGSLMLEYGESIIFSASALAVYSAYLVVSAEGRSRFLKGLGSIRQSWSAMALFFIVGWSFLSALWSQARLDTLGSSILYLTLLMYFIALKDDFNEAHHRQGFVAAWTLAMAFVMGKLVWQYGGALARGESIGRDRYLSTIENSNNLGLISLMFFCFCLAMALAARAWWSRALYAVLSLACLAGVLTSRSRSSLVVFGALLLYIIWKYNPKYILGLILLAGAVILSPQLQLRFLDIFSYEQNVQRIKVWRAALILFRENPILGTGANAFRVGYVRVFAANPQLFNLYDIKVLWHAHSMILRFASELGLPGLLASLFLMAGSWRMMKNIHSFLGPDSGSRQSNLQAKVKTAESPLEKTTQAVFPEESEAGAQKALIRASRESETGEAAARRFITTSVAEPSPAILMRGIALGLLVFYLASLLDSYWLMPKPLLVFVFFLGLAGGYASDHQLPS